MSQIFKKINSEDKAAHLVEKPPAPTEVYCQNKNQVKCLVDIKVPCEVMLLMHSFTSLPSNW